MMTKQMKWLCAACVLMMMGVGGCESADRKWKIVRPDPVTFTKDHTEVADTKPVAPEAGAAKSGEIPVTPPEQVGTLTGLSRENWESQSVNPVRGHVPHRPRYFTDEWVWGKEYRLTEDRPSPLTRDASRLEEQAARATAGSRHKLFDKHQWGDAGLGMVKVGHDIVVWPYTIVQSPPWQTHHTPPKE